MSGFSNNRASIVSASRSIKVLAMTNPSTRWNQWFIKVWNCACFFQVHKFEQQLDCLHVCSNIDCHDNCNHYLFGVHMMMSQNLDKKSTRQEKSLGQSCEQIQCVCPHNNMSVHLVPTFFANLFRDWHTAANPPFWFTKYLHAWSAQITSKLPQQSHQV